MESGVQCVMTVFLRQKQILFVDNLGSLATSATELLVLIFLGMCMHIYSIFATVYIFEYTECSRIPCADNTYMHQRLACTLNVTYGNHNPLPATIPSLLGTVPHAHSHTSVGSV